jgi:hypothetical protein
MAGATRLIVWLLCFGWAGLILPVSAAPFAEVQQFLGRYCADCHAGTDAEGGLAVETLTVETARTTDRATWVRVLNQLRGRAMPPDDAAQPSDTDRQMLEAWITQVALKADCSGGERPGRVTIRRLNRQEYDNTIRDLFGVDLQVARTFPHDDVGYGFDSIGDVLSVSPVLFERYVDAAEEIVRTVIASNDVDAAETQQLKGETLGRTGQFVRDTEISSAGDYLLRVEAWGDQAGPQPCLMLVGMDGRPIKKVPVPNGPGDPIDYEFQLKLEAGKHQFGVAFLNDFFLAAEQNGGKKLDRNLHIDAVELIGPIGGPPENPPEFHQRFFDPPIDREATIESQTDAAMHLLNPLASRAFRRRATVTEIEGLGDIFRLARRNGEPIERATQLAIAAVLVSPSFLFRLEADPEQGQVRELNDFELASRLSYFLWSSMPDDELFRAAARGELHTADQLVSQARRMLRDERVTALVENFAGQWLQLRALEEFFPSRKHFPAFDSDLRRAMRRETELFFATIIAEDRSILEFLDADYTFVNERLAKHYGIPDIETADFQKVGLAGGRRGGLLGQASILAVTSNPTRTNPVKRGKWILETLFGSPPPEPPAGVPQLAEAGTSQLTGTLRERMEQHRADPACATCHKMLDPLGFGLENYDAIGSWRDHEGSFPIDASGELPDGKKFSGPAELRALLLDRADDFRRCFAEKMLTYALGRGLEYYDACAIERIVANCRAGDDRFAVVIEEIVKSPAFQQRESGGQE